MLSTPRVFMSYSWDDDAHKGWVRDLATRLRRGGIEVTLDQWHAVPGDQLPQFMETAVRESGHTILVCTPNYKWKSDLRQGGVGYEGDVMTAEVLVRNDHRKFIPVLRRGNWVDAAPSWALGKYYVDLRGDPYSEDSYRELALTLQGRRSEAPPVGDRSRPEPCPLGPRPVIAVTQIREMEMEVVAACARCNGSGRIWPVNPDSRPCWVCNGKGKLLLKIARLPLVNCARCSGSGRVWPTDHDSRECASCEGAGQRPVAGPMRIVR